MMPPVNLKKKVKNIVNERKLERKKWREQKLLKAADEVRKGLQETHNLNVGCNELIPEAKFGLNDRSNISDINSQRPKSASSYTLSIAVPGSILENAQSQELRTYLAGQIGRACSIYCVDEVIVFDDGGTQGSDGIYKPGENSCSQLGRLLQYLECPQYLRKHVFPIHKDLQYAGVLNPLEAPHHLRQTDDFPFRDGVVTHHLVKHGKGSFVHVGLPRDISVDKALSPGIRVTVRMLPQKDGSKKRYGLIVPPSQPREELGVYWGYNVRLASSLSNVFAKAPYQEGYDLTIGTSDKGTPIDKCENADFSGYKHVLVVFGGLAGLESALECDENLSINDVSLLFDKYLNTCPNQGSRTIRTEEAILISLSQIKSKLGCHTLSI